MYHLLIDACVGCGSHGAFPGAGQYGVVTVTDYGSGSLERTLPEDVDETQWNMTRFVDMDGVCLEFSGRAVGRGQLVRYDTCRPYFPYSTDPRPYKPLPDLIVRLDKWLRKKIGFEMGWFVYRLAAWSDVWFGSGETEEVPPITFGLETLHALRPFAVRVLIMLLFFWPGLAVVFGCQRVGSASANLMLRPMKEANAARQRQAEEYMKQLQAEHEQRLRKALQKKQAEQPVGRARRGQGQPRRRNNAVAETSGEA